MAHVDHGKTTLVDAMLRQSGALTHRGDDAIERAHALDHVSNRCLVRRPAAEPFAVGGERDKEVGAARASVGGSEVAG